MGAAPPAARPRARHRPRHGPRAPHHRRPRPHRRCRCPPVVGLCTDDAVNGAPFYVMDYVDGVVARDAEPRRAPHPEARRARRRPSLVDVLVDDPRRRRRRRRPRRPRPPRGLRRAPAQALVAPVRGHRRDRVAPGRWTSCTTAWRPSVPAQQGTHDRPRRLPPRQLHHRPRRRGRGRARLGAVHARRPARRRRAAVGVLDRGRRPPSPRRSRRRPPSTASRPGPRCSPSTPSGPGATSPTSTSTSPSGTGSWPASSRGSSSATEPGPWAPTAPTPSEGYGARVVEMGEAGMAALSGQHGALRG